jgi:hypothetical protein
MRRAITVAVRLTENKYGISMVGDSGERFVFAFSIAARDLAGTCQCDKATIHAVVERIWGMFCERQAAASAEPGRVEKRN